MKIAVPAKSADFNAPLDERFGRCAFFVLYDTATRTHQIFPNPAAGEAHGAGPKALQAILAAGAAVLIAARVGENAERALQGAGLSVVLTDAETVREAVEAFLKDHLENV